MDGKKRIEVNPVKLGIAFAVVVLIVLVVISLMQVFRKNPYGDQVDIGNFSQYFSDAPDKTRDAMFAALYAIVSENVEDAQKIPSRGGVVRSGSVENNYDESKNLHTGQFIVDIEELGQSYAGHFEWSDDENNAALSGYTAIYTCLDEKDLIYGDFNCKDMFSDSITRKFPIIEKLPLNVEFYSNNYSSYTHYYISFRIIGDESGIILKITDYTGGNRENGLKKIRELGFNPDDYDIEYEDVSSEDEWVYVGNS